MQSALIEYQFFSTDSIEWISVSVSSFFLIFAAEFGDKSQLVCMTLAFRYKSAKEGINITSTGTLKLGAKALFVGSGI